MLRPLHIMAVLAITVAALPFVCRAQANSASAPVAPQLTNELRTGDFDAMLERRQIRVLVPYSRTLYFNDKGRESGLSAENVRDFEIYLNKKYRKQLKNRPITIVLIPTSRADLIRNLVHGLGDIAAGNLTETPERTLHVDFFAPADFRSVSEIVVTSKQAGPVASDDALSGMSVYVRKSSSYYASLDSLNRRFSAAGQPPVKIVAVDEDLEDEDIMEMVDAGVIDATIVDDWKARMWARALPHLVLNPGAAVRTGAHAGWAFRKNSPLLAAEIAAFYQSHKSVGTFNYRLAQYEKKAKKLRDPTGREDWKHFADTIALFEKYGQQYGFDPLMLAAQGFQESGLNQSARGPTGAVGIMQVMPATGKSLKVGDITVTEPNIHAGTKYMSELLTTYFEGAHFDEKNRTLFAFAGYNAGPNRIAKLRNVAATRGLDPNVWFDNVEIIVSEKIGRETTTYVRNILKYYVSYKLTLEREQESKRAREAMKPGH
ncbi:MAG TPA: transporter substrate-binding domain-containing protein [Candidatus Krumholzibacteria bacterium]|nr:transporter substrate-binding domain-containing protein [Candidatus Krumholzibacteria bacterium]